MIISRFCINLSGVVKDSNHEILHELKFNNFIDVVQLYYTRKIATT